MFTEVVLPVHLCRAECLLWLLPARGLFSECLVEFFGGLFAYSELVK